MLYGAIAFNQNIGRWNVASVSTMNAMFYGAVAFDQNLAAWNTAKVDGMNAMFYEAASFNQNLAGWNTASVSDMVQMFQSAAAFNQNLAGWNTASVSIMYRMLYGAIAFNQNLASWNVLSVTSLASAFDSTTALSSCNKRSVYDAWGATLRLEYPTFASGSCLDFTSFSPLNAPVSRDAALTILGTYFGTADQSPSAYVTGQPCATTSWTTATQLVCAAPAPILASGTSAVTRPALCALTARFCSFGSRGVDQSRHEH
jgi:surface protein